MPKAPAKLGEILLKSHEKRYIISMRNPIKQTSLKEDAGKVLVDIGKLIFGSVFLGSILNGSIPHMFFLSAVFLWLSVFV